VNVCTAGIIKRKKVFIMDDKQKKVNQTEKPESQSEYSEVGEDELLEISGGRMRDNVAITPTTDISNDTKKNI
jgi:hypothetical protein